MAWTAAHDELRKRVDQELEAYRTQMQRKTGCEVYAHAEDIAAMEFCHKQLTEHLGDYQVVDLEWLMGYMKPLEAMCSHWLIEQDVDLETEFDRIFRDWGYEEPESSMDAPGMT